MLSIRSIKLLTNYFGARHVSTASVMYGGGRFKTRTDPGIKRQVQILDEDDPFKSDVQDEEDIAALESDFANMDQAYDEHRKERRRKRELADKKITFKKYFAGPKPPNMLTWAERQQIKYLHNKDPDEWTVEVLSESFPATTETIAKLLRGKWRPEDPKKMARKDEKVHENWRLLAEGRLDAEPELIEHLNKFLGRREEYLESLASNNIEKYLDVPKPEERWNNGQMTSILESYEKKLVELESKQNNMKQISAKSLDEKNDEPEEAYLHIEDDKVVKVGHINKRAFPMTFDLLKKSMNTENGKEGQEFVKNNFSSGQIPPRVDNLAWEKKPNQHIELPNEKGSVTSRLAQLAGYKDQELSSVTDKGLNMGKKKARPKYVENNNSKVVSAGLSSQGSNKTDEGMGNALTETSEVVNNLERVNDTTELTIEELGEFLRKDNKSENKADQQTTSEVKEVKSSSGEAIEKIPFEFDPVRDHEEFEKEESSIEGTFFWAKDGIAKTSSEVVSKVNESAISVQSEKKPNALYNYGYPERIKIPKEKQGSGLTFRVKDCYYDDDGEFLYRVPGITQARTAKNEN